MSLEHVDRPVVEPADLRPDGGVEDQPTVEPKPPEPARPDPLKLFQAQWERYKPAYEFLAGKHK